EARRALLLIGEHRLALIGRADQLLLLVGFGLEDGPGVAHGRQREEPLGGTDRIGAPGGDLAREGERLAARIVADPRGESQRQRLPSVENTAGEGELPRDILA